MKPIRIHPLRSMLSAGTIAVLGTVAPLGIAQAAPVETDVIMQAIDDAGVNGSIEAQVNEDGVVRLTGLVDEAGDGLRAVNAVEAVPGITGVVDRMRTDDD